MTRDAVSRGLRDLFEAAGPGDTIFDYMAGHGMVVGNDYYFVTHDTDAKDPTTTAMPLERIKAMFDACRNDRVLLWLDFCHSGGIIPRGIAGAVAGTDAMRRALEAVQGQGRLIYAACTPEQFAYKDPKIGHDVFTAYLLEGLKGTAVQDGEVTANALFDYIDRRMGSGHQRPMQFGRMTGRLVLLHGDPRRMTASVTPAVAGGTALDRRATGACSAARYTRCPRSAAPPAATSSCSFRPETTGPTPRWPRSARPGSVVDRRWRSPTTATD